MLSIYCTKKRGITLVALFSISIFYAQTLVKGHVIDAVTNAPINEVKVTIQTTKQTQITTADGIFVFSENLPLGKHIIRLEKEDYQFKRYAIIITENEVLDIGNIYLDVLKNQTDLYTITLSDDELNDDTSSADNISGLLSSSKAIFDRTAAFEFSPSFFKIRGLDSNNGTLLINGIEMNKLFNGRPQWSNWGGLNDVLRNQEFTKGLLPSAYQFGGVLGTTAITTRASEYRKGGRLTYSSSNRSYTNRAMVSYASGETKTGWAYAFMAGKRWGNEGYQEATLYDSNSFFASVEKKISNKHSINFTAIYAPNRRGKSSANSQEVYNLKGTKYNEYWGWQDGKKRNSRIKKIEEPIFILNHYWNITNTSVLQTNVGYQFGKLSNSRLDYAGGESPSPTYYKKMPSYWLSDSSNPNYAQAYIAEHRFITNGQINWNRIYDANVTTNSVNEAAAYVLYEDRTDDKQLTLNSIFNTQLNTHITLNAALDYKKLDSKNYAKIIDLLGNTVGYLDNDAFTAFPNKAPNNVFTPNRYALEGDTFKYHYKLNASTFKGFLQSVFKYNTIDFFVATSISHTQYQREGIYKNGRHPNNSYGKGNTITFAGLAFKSGATYKITAKHFIDANVGYIQKAPTLNKIYTNSRESHDYIGVINTVKSADVNLNEEVILSSDVSYIFRSPLVKLQTTGFYTTVKNVSETSFFYVQTDNFNGFSQEVLVGANTLHMGVELGIEAEVLPTFKLKGAASIGQYTYSNNPYLYVTSSSDHVVSNTPNLGQAALSGTAYLKGYKLAAGPQKAYSFGFEYRDPAYWWFGATANYFSETYLDVSPILRTNNFYLDTDGLPYNDYNPEIAKTLLKQEQFNNYAVINLTGGKSWRVFKNYFGFFASIGNVLNTKYKTGGFEQGRKASYRALKEDMNSSKRVFGPRYWYARGTNYFLNVYYRF